MGSDFRLKVNITNLGNSKHLNDQTVSLSCQLRAGNAIQTFSKSQMIDLDQDTYIIPVKTSHLDKGDLFLKTTVGIPDTDFQSSTRTEIREIDTGITII